MKREADKELFKKILNIQSVTYQQWRMFRFLVTELKKLGATYYVKNGNLYAYRDKNYTMACVAHMDTVHDFVIGYTVHEANGRFFAYDTYKMKETGIGGDDKVGIFIALEMLKRHKHCAVAFFRDEEHGCVGSYKADMKFFKKCNIVLQADRKGWKDFVTDIMGEQLSSDTFQSDIKILLHLYARETCSGGLTDVLALKENGYRGSVANASCGYYRPHMDDEYIIYEDVLETLELFSDIYVTTKGKKYDFKATNTWDKWQRYTEPDYRKPINAMPPAKEVMPFDGEFGDYLEEKKREREEYGIDEDEWGEDIDTDEYWWRKHIAETNKTKL